MTTEKVQEAWQYLWDRNAKWCAEGKDDLFIQRGYWPTVYDVWYQLQKQGAVSKSSTQYHLHKLEGQEVVRRVWSGQEGGRYVPHSFFSDRREAQA